MVDGASCRKDGWMISCQMPNATRRPRSKEAKERVHCHALNYDKVFLPCCDFDSLYIVFGPS